MGARARVWGVWLMSVVHELERRGEGDLVGIRGEAFGLAGVGGGANLVEGLSPASGKGRGVLLFINLY
ncbi:hypothetical protein TIFTF001_007578 [Ficus carica]|uniref:Uncharacterized protein n=1 Tax=Ficus carica TaxID=3494 RepID=A0AA88A383_FICCA|nr:hypothetical protein TIFTF001_007578 [Ficus carica]